MLVGRIPAAPSRVAVGIFSEAFESFKDIGTELRGWDYRIDKQQEIKVFDELVYLLLHIIDRHCEESMTKTDQTEFFHDVVFFVCELYGEGGAIADGGRKEFKEEFAGALNKRQELYWDAKLITGDGKVKRKETVVYRFGLVVAKIARINDDLPKMLIAAKAAEYADQAIENMFSGFERSEDEDADLEDEMVAWRPR